MKIAKKLLALALAGTMVAFAGCGSTGPSWVARSGEDTVTAGTYQYFLINSYSTAVNLVADPYSDVLEQEIEGVPASNWIADESLMAVQRMLAVKNQYAERGMTLTDEEQDQIDSYTENQWTVYRDFLGDNGVSEDDLRAYYANNYMTNSLFFQMYGAGGEQEVGEEEIRSYFDENYINSNYLVCPKFDPETYNNLDEAGLAAARAEAEGYYNRALAGENFDDILADWEQANYTEEELASHTHDEEGAHDMVVPKTTTYVPEVFLQQVSEAEVGTPIFFEDDFYYYVAVRKDLTGPVADSTYESARTSILLALRSEDFIALCDQWISQMEIELNQEALDTYTPDRLNLEALLGDGSSSEETAGSLSLSSAEGESESSASASDAGEEAAESSESSSEATDGDSGSGTSDGSSSDNAGE